MPNVQAIRLASIRPILVQALYAVRLFDLEILSLTESAVDLVANSAVFADEGVRVADALHLTMAADFDADVLLSTDRHILRSIPASRITVIALCAAATLIWG